MFLFLPKRKPRHEIARDQGKDQSMSSHEVTTNKNVSHATAGLPNMNDICIGFFYKFLSGRVIWKALSHVLTAMFLNSHSPWGACLKIVATQPCFFRHPQSPRQVPDAEEPTHLGREDHLPWIYTRLACLLEPEAPLPPRSLMHQAGEDKSPCQSGQLGFRCSSGTSEVWARAQS